MKKILLAATIIITGYSTLIACDSKYPGVSAPVVIVSPDGAAAADAHGNILKKRFYPDIDRAIEAAMFCHSLRIYPDGRYFRDDRACL